MIDIYTDGSCKGNPGPGGWAAIFLRNNISSTEKILSGNDSHTTNNRMEMMAVIESLKFFHKNYSSEKNVTLYSDSNLIVQTVNQGWKRKANLDLWKEIDSVMEKISARQNGRPGGIRFVWVRGHANNKWNEECDKIAVEEAKKAMRNL